MSKKDSLIRDMTFLMETFLSSFEIFSISDLNQNTALLTSDLLKISSPNFNFHLISVSI